jgi:hypothetical protein
MTSTSDGRVGHKWHKSHPAFDDDTGNKMEQSFEGKKKFFLPTKLHLTSRNVRILDCFAPGRVIVTLLSYVAMKAVGFFLL